MAGRIVVLGNSHTHALKSAWTALGESSTFAIHWLRYKKGASALRGDISLEDAQTLVSSLDVSDLLAIHLYGTQHIHLGLFQHDEPFDIADENGAADHVTDDVSIIPRQVLREDIIGKIKRAPKQTTNLFKARCRVVFLMAPPPKNDDAGIAEYFKAKNVAYKVNAAPRRLRIWQLERGAVSEYAASIGSETVEIPPETVDEDGFLLPEFSAHDAGHANRQYGAVVLQQLSGLLSCGERASLVA